MQPRTSTDQSGSSTAQDSSYTHFVTGNTGKRDILKATRSTESLFSGPYDGVILSSVKRQFLQDCNAFEVPENQQLSVLHIMFKDNALRYFTDHVKPKVRNVEQAFEEMKKHFITEAHVNTYTTEWNTLSFRDFKNKEKGKSDSEILDMLYYRAQDLQSLLDTPYQSRLLLRDCIIRAVNAEPFYAPLTTMPIPRDPDELHIRLHQVMKQQDTAAPSGTSSTPLNQNSLRSLSAYYFDDDPTSNDDPDPTEFEILFNQNGKPFFKRRIMRGSSSFNPSKSNHYNRHPRHYDQYNNTPRFGYTKR